MCNLYSLTKGQAAIRDWFRASIDRTGNLPLFPGIFPDQMAPIVRNGADGARELVMARWGMPGPPQFGGAPITNIRNVGSPHWRGWLGAGEPAVANHVGDQNRREFPDLAHPAFSKQATT
jgi:putative SOS response-associated peptidase YedK